MQNKVGARPTMNCIETAENVKFQQEYKKALKAQNKTFNQNGKFKLDFLRGLCSHN